MEVFQPARHQRRFPRLPLAGHRLSADQTHHTVGTVCDITAHAPGSEHTCGYTSHIGLLAFSPESVEQR